MSDANGTEPPTNVPVSLRSVKRYAENPLIDPAAVRGKKKTTAVIGRDPHGNFKTGEVTGHSAILVTRQIDAEAFVKVFDEGIRAAFDLTGAGFKVFQLVLKIVATGKMQDDKIYLHMSYATDPKSPLKMSDKTFWRGMRELIAKQFIAASTEPFLYWINPHLFFKGDRLVIVNEYVREQTKKVLRDSAVALPAAPPNLFTEGHE